MAAGVVGMQAPLFVGRLRRPRGPLAGARGCLVIAQCTLVRPYSWENDFPVIRTDADRMFPLFRLPLNKYVKFDKLANMLSHMNGLHTHLSTHSSMHTLARGRMLIRSN
jgi:hypothetical protein